MGTAILGREVEKYVYMMIMATVFLISDYLYRFEAFSRLGDVVYVDPEIWSELGCIHVVIAEVFQK